MGSMRGGFLKCIKEVTMHSRFPIGMCRGSQSWHSTMSFDEYEEKNDIEDDDFIDEKRGLEPQGVDPKKGWGFRGGMYDQRIIGAEHLPRPAQWHRIVVHNEHLGAYAVQQLVKNSAVFIEGDIETRVYNDSINGQVKNVPEICVRRDGKVRLVKSGDSATNISLDELREGLF
uniref:Single-stranded DNA-binding protein, mitochondrial isoform X2 n=1 Tax=Elaeis guineensis var. tenera TaxID=51953 RepID=A0A6I9R1N8_ELAGV|nr:single-stranded DNA-binding protein, mitochondrial isoform X2 [Elaeis guineensis]